MRSLRRSLDQADSARNALWLAGPHHRQPGSDDPVWAPWLALGRTSGRLGTTDRRRFALFPGGVRDRPCAATCDHTDRKSVVTGMSVPVRVSLSGASIIKKKKNNKKKI